MTHSSHRWTTALTLIHAIVAVGAMAEDSSSSHAAKDAQPVLTEIAGQPAGFDSDLAWEVTQGNPAVFRIDVPTAGLLSLLAISDDGDDIRMVVTDPMGVYRPFGDIDSDPDHVVGGEFGAVVVPAGPSLVVLGSLKGRQKGVLNLGLMPAPQVGDQPDPSKVFRAALPLTEGEPVTARAPSVDEARGGETAKYYRASYGDTGVVRLRYSVTDGKALNVYVYRSKAMWWPAEYELGKAGEILFYPEADENWFVVVRSDDLSEGATFKLTLDDPSRAARRAPR